MFQYIRGHEVQSIGKPEVSDRKTGSAASGSGDLVSVSGGFRTQGERSGGGKLFGERELEMTGGFPGHCTVCVRA